MGWARLIAVKVAGEGCDRPSGHWSLVSSCSLTAVNRSERNSGQEIREVIAIHETSQ